MIGGKYPEMFRLGLRNMWGYKLRSFLTVLGISFGVGCVIAMVALGEGAQRELLAKIGRLGIRNIIINSVKPSDEDDGGSGQTSWVASYGLTRKDYRQIRATVRSASVVLPVHTNSLRIWEGSKPVDARVHGVMPEHLNLFKLEVVRGRTLTPLDNLQLNQVCVVRPALLRALAFYGDPLGHYLAVGPDFFRIVGVLREEEFTGYARKALNAEAKMQAQYVLEMMMNADGLFPDSDGNIDYKGQWVLLEAFSDVGQTLGYDALPNSESNRYQDTNASGMFLGAAEELFAALAERMPADVQENSLAIQALTWYAATTGNADGKTQAIDKIASFGDALIAADKANATENASAIRGLVEAYRVTGDAKYKDAAAEAFNALVEDYNPETGIYKSQSVYTIDDVAVIMGALNSSRLFISDAVDGAKVEEQFTMFFNHAVNKSGLQQSVPPIEVAKSPFEQEEPPIYYGYPTIPMPPMAGGEFGIAPVFATEVSWDGSAWNATDGNFDAAGAMHVSNEFIWFHNDEVNGFPEIP